MRWTVWTVIAITVIITIFALCIKSALQGPPTEQPEATVAKRCGLFNQKKYGTMNEIYAHFDAWKDIDRFYFIPLKRNMTYSINGYCISMADEPLYLGSFIRTSLEHPDLFSFPCPLCSKRLYPYSYNGSPLSGRVDLEAECPECGWKGYEMVSGWRVRSNALKAIQKADQRRLRLVKLLHWRFKPATMEELLEFCQ